MALTGFSELGQRFDLLDFGVTLLLRQAVQRLLEEIRMRGKSGVLRYPIVVL